MKADNRPRMGGGATFITETMVFYMSNDVQRNLDKTEPELIDYFPWVKQCICSTKQFCDPTDFSMSPCASYHAWYFKDLCR